MIRPKNARGVAAGLAVLMTVTARAAGDVPVHVSPSAEPMASGPFEPTWASLESQHRTPDWFRDAKFGIWAHWSAQCVPEHGDWYARGMYQEGSDDYKDHLARYGHPSVQGFKDLDHAWHAEHWDPDKLMALYKRAGAQYFVALANHHDNFDCWDSKYQPWNSTRVGPMKDIVGTWAAVARRNGLRFGVSVHASHAWNWLEVSQGMDATGTHAGVRYDGTLTKADGVGQWWDGLDPQDLYCQQHHRGEESWTYDPRHCTLPDQAYCDKFYNRTVDLIDKYHPDLLYFDDTVMPLYGVSDAGFKIAAHLYNDGVRRTGHADAVMTGKGLTPDQRKAITWDLERGHADAAEPLPWQTDTCIGSWHYDRRILDRHGYKSATTVIHTLVDNVSKNGNLLLSVPVKPDGTIDDDEVKFLERMAAWMAVNGECVFGSRPWTTYGEGPSTEGKREGSDNFNEGKAKPFTAADVRYTAKGSAVYAVLLGWPDGGRVVLKALRAGSPDYPGEVGSVRLLGSDGDLEVDRQADGLHVTLPADKPCDHAFALRIERRA